MKATIAVAGAVALALSACSSPSAGEGTADSPVTLEMWAWGSNIDKRVDVWNEENPNIQVKISAPGAGVDFPVKVLSSVRAGEGPDIIQAEYTQLPTYVSAGVAANLQDDRAKIEEKFDENVLDTVTFDDQLFGIPQDLGPSLLIYRTDIFDENDLDTPETWDEFRDLAEKVRGLDGSPYLLNFGSLDADLFMGLSLQAGAQWWDYSGDGWTVNIDSPETAKVLEYWQGLIEDDLISTFQQGSPELNDAMATGRVISTLQGAWAPGPLMNQLPELAGKFAAAQIPQWSEGEHVTFARGGSANVIMEDSEHKEAAVEFLYWLNASDEGVTGLVEKANKFTGARLGQTLERTPPEFMPDDTEYWPAATLSAEGLANVQWGPNTQVAFTAVTDEIGQAIQGATPWTAVLPAVQKVVQADLNR